MNFIELHLTKTHATSAILNRSVWLRTDTITSMGQTTFTYHASDGSRHGEQKTSYVGTNDGQTYLVGESPEQVLKLLVDAEARAWATS